MKESPGWKAIWNGLRYIIRIRPNIYRDHILSIKFDHIEAWIFPCQGSYWTSKEVDPNVFIISDTLDYLDILFMSMPIHAESYNILESIH